MLDLTTKRPKTHLSDLLRRSSSSEDIFGNYYEPISRAPLTFSCDDAAVDDGSGASTPPLWRQSSPPGSPDRCRSVLYSSLSPGSRTEAIARGQMELMEMVKNMPESCYELSLKDLVEINHRHQAAAISGSKNNNLLGGGHGKIGNLVAKQVGARGAPLQMVRSGSLDNNNGGFLLKMVFPVSWGARKKKRDYCANTSNSLRASPVSEKEWWKKRNSSPAATFAFACRESESGESSLNSGSRKSSSGSSSSRRYEDCWSFIRSNRGKSLK